jgi:hypothetical protein
MICDGQAKRYRRLKEVLLILTAFITELILEAARRL